MKNDVLVDRFGRPNFMTVTDPFAIRSERISQGGGTVNTAVLEQGWLRVQGSPFKNRNVPKAASLTDAMPGEEPAKPNPMQMKKEVFNEGSKLSGAGVSTTAPPINTANDG